MRLTLLAAFGAAVLAAAPVAADAAPVPRQASGAEAFSRAQAGEVPAAYAQYRGRAYGGPRYVGRGGYYGRGGYGRGYYGRPYGYGYRYDRGNAAAAGVAGLAAGALIGGAIASQQAAPVYAAPGPDSVTYCSQRYRSYDPASGTYLGFDGLRHPCP